MIAVPITSAAGLRSQPSESIAKEAQTSRSAIALVTAAKKTSAKNRIAKKVPPAIFANTIGNVPKISPGPCPGSRPKANTAGKNTAEKKEVKTVAYVQYAGAEISIEKLEAEAKKAYAALGHKEDEIETLTLYVKPEERAVYYVVNGEGSSEYKIVY